MTWLDDVVTQLKTPGGAGALTFVEANYNTLLALGLDAVTQILDLFKTGQRQAALVALESRLTDPEMIIAYENQNATDCFARVKAWEKFKTEMESFALQLLPLVIKVAAGAASGGLAL